MSTNPNDSVQYLCARCGHPESEHPCHGCVGFAFEERKFVAGIYATDKERAELLESMVDRMSDTIADQRAELFYLRRKNYELDHDKGLLVARIANLEKMITRNA